MWPGLGIGNKVLSQGHAQHHTEVPRVKHNSKNNCSHMKYNHCNSLRKLYILYF